MKNDSWRYPFETFGDDAFDSNKDGKLTGMETVIRDAHLDDVNRNAAQWDKDKNRTYSGNNYSSDSSGCLSTFIICFIVLVIVAFIKSLF